MSTPLLTTKLYLPRARPELVPRPRLIARLNRGARRKLTLVSAPAGSGKTTLIATWLSGFRLDARDTPDAHPESWTQDRVAWLSLDEGDNDPLRFFAYLVAALQRVDGGLGQGVQRTLDGPGSRALAPPIAALINDVAALDARLVLVLDDYHTIDALPIHEAIGFLLDRQPPQLHLVITTRHDPPLPLSRLRGRDQMTEIREQDLRFTAGEAAAFLNDAMGLALSTAQIEALEDRTEGWITGLQLAALSMQGRDAAGISRFIAGFSGRYHLILDYLTDEVLHRQPESIQTFLLQTSILQRLCGPLCDALLEGRRLAPAKQILEQIEAANLFTAPLDDEHEWYRYHPLFAELLQARLQEIQPNEVPGLHRRAADWYERAGFSSEAVRHALATQDSALAAEVIERAILKLATWSRTDTTMILMWLGALPDEATRSRPWLRLFHSRTLYISGQPEVAGQVLQELEDWLRDHPAAPDAKKLSDLVTVDRASYAAVLGQVRLAKELAQRAMAHAPEDDPIARFRAPAILGMACLRAGDVVEASLAFTQASDVAREAGLSFAVVPFLCNLAETQIARGQLRQAMQTCEQASQVGTVDGQPIFAAGFVGLQMGKLFYEWNDLHAAEHHLSEGLELLSRGGISEGFGSIHALLAQVKQALGDHEAALAAAQQALQIAQHDNILRLVTLASAYQARVWLAQGQLDLAAQWAGEYQQMGDTEYLREFEDLTLVRVLQARGEPTRALALLDALLPPARAAGRMRAVVEIQALRGLALHALDDLAGALAALGQALALAEPEGYVRSFVDLGRPIATLLREAASRGLAPGYVSRLLSAFGPPEAEDERARPVQPLVEPLTERELQVLQLLAEGLSNREIGRRLVISLPTVKSHTRNIYGKLGVHSREEAVTQAEALGILSSLSR